MKILDKAKHFHNKAKHFHNKAKLCHGKTESVLNRALLSATLLLSAVASALAQPSGLRADNARKEMGTILWNAPQTAVFTVTNTTAKEISIVSVRPDCGCTSADWQQTALAPGASATISATYDAALLGHFEKQIAVYTTESVDPLWLTVSGNVAMELGGASSNFAYHIGDIYLDADNVEFDDVRRGDTPVKTLRIYNASKQSFSPQLMHLPRYLSVTAEPETVRPGRSGRLNFQLDTEALRSYGLTASNVYLSRYAGDRVGRDNEIYISATLLPELENADPNASPAAVVDSTTIHLGSLSAAKKAKREVILTNTGRAPLKVTALQVYNPGLGVSIGKRVIEPGKSEKIKITLSSSAANLKGRRRVLVITNDPVNPKLVIDVLVDK